MRLRFLLAIVFILTLSFSTRNSFAQKNTRSQIYSDNWRKGHDLLKRKDFGGARYCFQQVSAKESDFSDKKIEAEYYLAYCGIELSRPEAEKKMLRFLEKYPGNSMEYQAYFQLGRLQYKQDEYEKALTWFEKVEVDQFATEEKDEFLFMRAYSNFKNENMDQANQDFNELIERKGEFQLPANYYYGHIAYKNEDYDAALSAFAKVENDETYVDLIPYYITQIYYLKKKYDELIVYAPKFLEKADTDRASEIAKMLGLAYYNQKKYADAIPYLIRDKDNLNREETFALAFSYYQVRNYENAGQLFAKVKEEEDAISQLSFYNIADCFLHVENKNRARYAFGKAFAIDFDAEITKNAHFNFAKISYELWYAEGKEAIDVFDDYLGLYPNSENNEEAYTFFENVYLTTKNYEGAILSMDKIKNKSLRMKEAYQRAAYFRALELFNESEFVTAIEYFDKSLKYKISENAIATNCLYWKAESYYSLDNFIVAIESYKDFILIPNARHSEYFEKAYYNLAYCEFELDAYSKAIKWFHKYEQLMNGKSSAYLTDVQNRIGDCYFLARNYDKASEYYSKSIRANNWSTDYAVYQNALALGLLGRVNDKISLLKSFSRKFPESDYIDDSLFELAKAKVKKGNENAALKRYKNLITDYPESEYAAKALLQLGQLNYNKKDYAEAIKNYKQIIVDYPNNKESKSALMGLKNIYIDMNNIQAYFTFAESLGTDNTVDISEKDSLTYLSAERLYMDGDLEQSSLAFASYLKDYPTGMFQLNATYYQGESAYNKENYKEALLAFEMVVQRGDNLFTEKALLGASQIYFKQKESVKALEYYRLLKDKTQIVENRLIADWGLFRCYYELKKYQELIQLSNQLILSSKNDKYQQKEIQYKRSKAYLALKKDALAEAGLKQLAKNVQTKEGAESRFLWADLLYRNKKGSEAEKRINEFIEMNSPHHFWLGKSFILLSDIFMDKKDVFQARYTLQSIVDNYATDDDGIIEVAKAKLKLILKNDKTSNTKSDTLSTSKVKPVTRDVNAKKRVKSDSLSAEDAKTMLNEMLGELED